MAKKTAIEKAIDELEAKRIELRREFQSKEAGIDAAITALRNQKPRARKSKVAAMPLASGE